MKKLVTLLTALTLMFTSAALAETAFKTDEAGHPVFENFGEAKQYARAGLIESDYYMIIVPHFTASERIMMKKQKLFMRIIRNSLKTKSWPMMQ